MAGLDALLTPRLRGERMTWAHHADVSCLHQNERYMTFMGGVRDEDAIRAYLDRNIGHWDEYGFGIWILRDSISGRLAGSGGLRHLDVDGVEEVEVGYGVLPDLWGRGLGAEVAQACVTVARDALGLASVIACSDPANVASIGVMRRTGFRCERTVVLPACESVLYRLKFGNKRKPLLRGR